MNPYRSCIAVTGASGFIGRHFIRTLACDENTEIRILVHHDPLPGMDNKSNITIVEGDLMKPDSLKGFLKPDCTVVNLAYMRSADLQDHLKATTHLASACRATRVKRVVHCSTAVVVGVSPDPEITERTPCKPAPGYESTKFEMERIIAEKAAGRFDLAILRPTAVFGPGGKNLIKLADDLTLGSGVLNYLKSCLFDCRRMNLVSVGHVVSALSFLTFAEQRWEGGVFIVSDDDHPRNTYRDVEKYLMDALGRRDYAIPRIPAPTPVLSALLRLTGRSNSNPLRRYGAGKLRAAGFRNEVSFESGLDAFAYWYRMRLADPAAESS